MTSGLLANTNEDAYLFIQTGITVNGVAGSVSDLSDASLGINPGSVTITNNDADGGSFVYTASDGIETDTATVSVEIDAAPMAGDNNDEILVGTSAAETIDGGGGNNILIGGGGADTLIGGNGDDVLVYAPGVSLINGGTSGPVDLRAADKRGDVLSVEGTVDFPSLGDVFQDIETISMLAKDGSNGNSTITLDITNVLNLAIPPSPLLPAAAVSPPSKQSASMARPAMSSIWVRIQEPGCWQRVQTKSPMVTPHIHM